MNLSNLTQAQKTSLIEAYDAKDFREVAIIIIKNKCMSGCGSCIYDNFTAALHIEKLKNEME